MLPRAYQTFLSEKSRGFGLYRNHVADAARLERLLIAACLAYVWLLLEHLLKANLPTHFDIHLNPLVDLGLELSGSESNSFSYMMRRSEVSVQEEPGGGSLRGLLEEWL